MSAANHQGLVVESSFKLRKELLSELRSVDTFSRVFDARSVDDGLNIISVEKIDLCLIGPSLKSNAAEIFLNNASQMSRQESCSFLAVLEKDSTVVPDWISHLRVFDTLQLPIRSGHFKAIVDRAISRVPSVKPSLVAKPKTLSQSLTIAATVFTDLANSVAESKFVVSEHGGASLATRDAIRLALQRALPDQTEANQIGSFDNFFIGALVDWFVDRQSLPPAAAAARLRKRLLEFIKTTT